MISGFFFISWKPHLQIDVHGERAPPCGLYQYCVNALLIERYWLHFTLFTGSVQCLQRSEDQAANIKLFYYFYLRDVK